jgi:Carboxylesterase family
MANHPPQPDAINRRALLRLGTASALAVGSASAMEQPNTATQFAAKAASNSEAPNLHPPVVQVKGGKLRGLKDARVFTFLGIPYAQAERFEMPKPVPAWDGIKGAQVWGPVCPIPQATSVGADDVVLPHRYWVENENCQVLNVWTQSLSTNAKKPVMVWMHGGGFTNGSSMESYAYDGKTLSEFGDVVAVSVNHRLNIIGTLDLSAYDRNTPTPGTRVGRFSGCPRVGSRQYRSVRRQSRKYDDLRAIWRRRQGDSPHADALGKGSLSQGNL